MGHLPAISVVMAVYNGDEYLGTSIDSILNQTFANFEFIIVDDGSIDTTPIILKQYALLDKRIKPNNNNNKQRQSNAAQDQAARINNNNT